MEQALPLEPLQGLRVPGGTPLSDILLFVLVCRRPEQLKEFVLALWVMTAHHGKLQGSAPELKFGLFHFVMVQ